MLKHCKNIFCFFTANSPSWLVNLPFSIQRTPHTPYRQWYRRRSKQGPTSKQGLGKRGDGFSSPSLSPGKPLVGCHDHIYMNKVCNSPSQAGLISSGLPPLDVLRSETLTSYGHRAGWPCNMGLYPSRMPEPRPATQSVFSIPRVLML